MSILVTCECGKQFQTGEEYAGRRARCPECGRELIIAGTHDSPYAPPKSRAEPEDEFGQWAAKEERTSGKAIASLALGLSSLVCSITVILGLITGVLAIVFGALGLGDIKEGHGRVKGRGMALTGMVTGALSCSLIPVLLVLIALLLPAVQSAREAARRAMCVNNLKQIGLAMHNFQNAENHFPPAAITDANGKPLLSWRVAILPYIEQEPLYREFKLDEPWDSAHNRALIARMPKVYACPSDTASDSTTMTRYQVCAGPGTLFDGPEGVRLKDVSDGTSDTLMAAEANDPVTWTKPEDLRFNPNAPPPTLGSRHSGGVNAVMADGSVRFLKKTISPAILRALITRNGGEVISAGAF